MTRRDVMLAFGALSAAVVGAGEPVGSREGNELRYREYYRCLPDATRRLASEAAGRRSEILRTLTTPGAIAERQRWARETFWTLIGGQRGRLSPEVRKTGSLERPHYTVEKLAYRGRKGEWISGNLYLPRTGERRLPAVLFQAGHTKNGKAGHTYQYCCQGLVQLGFAVLTFDPIGQGERTNYPGADGLTRFGEADDEHTVPGRQLLIVGETMTRLQLEDAMTSLDVLSAHPRIDPQKICAAGQSGGGTLTMMLAAVDDRVAAAVVCSGNTENVACSNFCPPGSVDDAEQNFINSGAVGFDRWDLLWPFAPRPLLILVSAKDFYGTYSPNYLRNGRAEVSHLAGAYGVLGRTAHLRYEESPLPHALSPVLRLKLYRWASERLLESRAPIQSEPPVKAEVDSDLWVTPSGSVVRDLASQTPLALIRRKAASVETPTHVPDLNNLLRISAPSVPPRLDVLATVPSRHCHITAAEVQTSPDVWVPMWIFEPNHPARKMIIVLDPSGRNEGWGEDDLYQELAREMLVCVPDLRGFGDLQPELSSGAPAYALSHSSDEAYAWASLILGRPLLGQRVQDLCAVIEATRRKFGRPVDLLAARGALTVPALCAAVLDRGVRRLYLYGHLASWRSVTEYEEYIVPFSNFVPNVLEETDLPYLAAALAPRTVRISGCLDARGQNMAHEQVRSLYRSSNVEIAGRTAWDSNAFVSLL